MPMGSPAAAARKAAARTTLRISPPVSRNPAASWSRSTSGSRGASAGRQTCQMRRRSASSGNGNSTTNCSRRMNASSRLLPQVGRQDGEPVVLLHPLQQVGRPRCWRSGRGRPGPRSACRTARRPRRTTGCALALGRRGEDPLEVLLGLADVLADDRGEVDLVEVQPELAGDDLGGHGLAGARRPGEQRADARARRRAPARTPSSSSTRPRWRHPVAQLAQLRQRRRRGSTMSAQPRRGSILRGQRRELVPRLGAGRGEQLPAVRGRRVAGAGHPQPGRRDGRGRRLLDPSGAEPEALTELVEIGRGGGDAVRRQRLAPTARRRRPGRRPAERHGQHAQRRRPPRRPVRVPASVDEPAVRGQPSASRRAQRHPLVAPQRVDAVQVQQRVVPSRACGTPPRRRPPPPRRPRAGRRGRRPGAARRPHAASASAARCRPRAARPLEVQPQRVPRRRRPRPAPAAGRRDRSPSPAAGLDQPGTPLEPRVQARPGRAARRPPGGRRRGGGPAAAGRRPADRGAARSARGAAAPSPARQRRRAASRSAGVRVSRSGRGPPSAGAG